MENVLEVRDLEVSYLEESSNVFKNRNRIPVLNGISFDIKKGEILGLVGESGCGKSTLAKTIVGMIENYKGQINFECKKPLMIFQDPYGSLNPAYNIGWILKEPLRIKKGYTASEMDLKAREMLKRVGLDEKMMKRYPDQLSGGQRQRVCIAQALILEPELLILDEPVSALDVTIQAQIIKLLQEIQEEFNITMLFISHDLRIVYQMSDRVMIMQKGKIVEIGTLDEVYFSPKEDYTKILLDAAGIEID